MDRLLTDRRTSVSKSPRPNRPCAHRPLEEGRVVGKGSRLRMDAPNPCDACRHPRACHGAARTRRAWRRRELMTRRGWLCDGPSTWRFLRDSAAGRCRSRGWTHASSDKTGASSKRNVQTPVFPWCTRRNVSPSRMRMPAPEPFRRGHSRVESEDDALANVRSFVRGRGLGRAAASGRTRRRGGGEGCGGTHPGRWTVMRPAAIQACITPASCRRRREVRCR